MIQNSEQLIQETMESYYEYISKLQSGCDAIITAFKEGDKVSGFQGIIDLSEGLEWLLDAEKLLSIHAYKIDSPIGSISPLFRKINDAIEKNDLLEVTTLLEDEVRPMFVNIKEWKFTRIQN